MKLIPVEPIGSRASLAFVERTDGTGGVEDVEWQTYPSEHQARGQELRTTRIGAHVSLRRAALALEVSVLEMCDLERGAATLSDEEWASALRILTEMPQEGA